MENEFSHWQLFQHFHSNYLLCKPQYGHSTVYLTFDDGPSKYLENILEILDLYVVKSTFFFWASRINDSNGDIVHNTVTKGHCIGNHSMSHADMTQLSYQEQYNEIKLANDRIYKYSNKITPYFRPPYGRFNHDTGKALKQLNMQAVLWSIDSKDTKTQDPDTLLNTVISKLHRGSIILCHEREHTLSVLPKLIEQIKNKGYEFLPLYD